MKNIVLFFCDLTGTIIGREENSIIDYQRFYQLLLNIQNTEQVENLIFSLVSSDVHKIINNHTNIFKEFFSEPIILGKQFFDNGYIINNKIYSTNQSKIEQILTYINELNKKFNIIKIYYADDCEFFHIILNEIINNDILTSIIPQKKQGLRELNNLLENEIIYQNNHLLKNI